MPHHTIAHARGTAGRGLSPGRPESRVRNYEELYEYIQRLSRLNVTRRYPRSFHSPTVAQLKVSFSRLINLQMMQVNASSATRLAVNAALERLPNTIYESAIDFMNEHPQHMQLLLWYLFQRGYVSRVVQEIIRGFLEALPGIIRQRNSRQLQKRGEFFIRAHLALAANSTLFPFIFLFLAGAIKKIIADTYQLIRQLYRYNVEPEGITLDLLKALTPLLELAFAEEENGLGRGHRLGRNLADGFASEIEDVIFPNPVGDDGPIVYGVVGVEILRRFDENSIVRKLASLLMVPWSMGAFIGPLLIDIILTIIGLVFPELGLLALLRNVSGLRRIMELVNGVMDAASRALKAQRRFQRSVRDITPDITPGDASPRARGISGTGGESQAARVGAGSAAESQEVQSRHRRRRGREHHEQMELGQERPTRQETRARREAASQAGEANRVVRDRETGQTQRATSSARLQTEAPSSQRQQSRQATRQRLQETPEELPPAGDRGTRQTETVAPPNQARQAAPQTSRQRQPPQERLQRRPDIPERSPEPAVPRDPRGTGDPGNQRPETGAEIPEEEAGPLLLRGFGVYNVQFREAVETAIQRLRDRGVSGLGPREYGVRLHSEIRSIAEERGIQLPQGFEVISETSMEQLATRFEIPGNLLNQRVLDFIETATLSASVRRTLRARYGSNPQIRNLQPDLIIDNGAMDVTVLDVTSRQTAEHLAKTQLYRAVLQSGGRRVALGEQYWRRPPRAE